MARDRGAPPLVFQLLVYPVTHCDFTTDSYQRCADGYLLSRAGMEWYWDHYLRDTADAANPYAAPLVATDLSGSRRHWSSRQSLIHCAMRESLCPASPGRGSANNV